MDTKTLKRLQDTEFEILNVINDFCKEHNITYSLYAGTALGAVRHGGFIPWDDDVDICMTRREFAKFIRKWNENSPPGYYLQFCADDKYCGTAHAKIRKEGTVLLSEGEDESKGTHGIWVDIFPLDKRVSRFDFALVNGFLLILLTRANVNMSTDSALKKLERKLLQIFPYSMRKKIIVFCLKVLGLNDKFVKNSFYWSSMSAVYALKLKYPAEMTEEVTEIEFEGKKFLVYKEYDQMLRICYGDYMKLPPVEERVCRHAPVKIKF